MGLGSNPRLGGSGPCCRIPLDADSNGLQTPIPPRSFKPAPTGSESQEHTCRRGFRGLYSIILIYICLLFRRVCHILPDGFAICLRRFCHIYQTGLRYLFFAIIIIFTRRVCDIWQTGLPYFLFARPLVSFYLLIFLPSTILEVESPHLKRAV